MLPRCPCQRPVGPLPWEGSGGHPAATVSLPSTVKADKKAAQEKMIQQEHERQVRPGQGGRRVSERRLGRPSPPPHCHLCLRSGKTSSAPWPGRSG